MINLLITLGYHAFYTVFIIIYLGYVDSSYSDTFYKLKKWRKFYFWGWIVLITVPMIYYLRDDSVFASFGCLCVLGVLFSSYTVGLKKRTVFHVISATGGIVLMLVGFAVELANWSDWNIFNYAVIVMIIELIVILPIGKFKKGIPKHTFWIEFAMIVTPVIALIIDKIKTNEKAT